MSRLVIACRVGFRLARVAAHLAAGLLTVAVVFPRVSVATRRQIKQHWSRRLLGCLGVDVRALGGAPAGGLIVGNHVSWLDIFVINAISPAAFVCKDDVRRWPLIGWLCAGNETIFIARGSSRDAKQVGAGIAAVLADGGSVAVFPEGTTSDGTQLLPFKSALLQPAVELRAGVQPVLIRYLDEAGGLSAAPVYIGTTTLLESMRRIAARPMTLARLDFLPTIDPSGMTRRDLAGTLETSLWEALQRRGRDERGGVATRPARTVSLQPSAVVAEAG